MKLLFHGDKSLMGLVNEGSPFDINDSELNRTTIDTIDVKIMNDSYSETENEDGENSRYNNNNDSARYYDLA